MRRILSILTVATVVATIWIVAGATATGAELSSWASGDDSHVAIYYEHPTGWGLDYDRIATTHFDHVHFTFW